MPAKSNSDIPFEAAVSRRSSCKYRPTSQTRHVSMIATKSTSERPIRSMLLISTFCTLPDRIAWIRVAWPGRRSRPRLNIVDRSTKTFVTIQPLSAATARRLAACSSADTGQSDDERA
jgi:hypothetical protein